jgi:hypothetical protein
MTTKARSKGLADVAQPTQEAAKLLAGVWNGLISRAEVVVRALRIERGARHRLVPSSEATHERFAREEDYPAVLLTAGQSDELRRAEQAPRKVRTRTGSRKSRRTAKT